MTELKINIWHFAAKWQSDGEAFAWESLIYGEVGHDPPWHIVNAPNWTGPLYTSRKKANPQNKSLCINERTGVHRRLSRGRKGPPPSKNERCPACTEIMLNYMKFLKGEPLECQAYERVE